MRMASLLGCKAAKAVGYSLMAWVVGCSASVAKDKAPDASTSDTANNLGQLNTCDPLARQPLSIGPIVGIGQDDQSTLYLADQSSSSMPRVFVSQGAALYQRYVRGSGQSGTGYTLSYDDSDNLGIPPHALLVQTQDGQASAMGLADEGTRFFIGDADATYAPLTLVDSTAIAGVALMSLPYEFEFIAIDNVTTVVTIPINGDYASARVFYGPKDNVQQRTVTSVEFGGALSAPTCTVHFLVGSDELQVTLGGSAATTGDGAIPLPYGLADLAFYCLTD
jgi:hypothetical protein